VADAMTWESPEERAILRDDRCRLWRGLPSMYEGTVQPMRDIDTIIYQREHILNLQKERDAMRDALTERDKTIAEQARRIEESEGHKQHSDAVFAAAEEIGWCKYNSQDPISFIMDHIEELEALLQECLDRTIVATNDKCDVPNLRGRILLALAKKEKL
jgi:hypothetical protein